jgi:predicted RecA/RadA family phage recombinase
MAADCIPLYEPGDRITCTPTAAVQGKRFVAISGNQQADGTFSVAPPTAAGRVLGVAAWDAAVGSKVTVIKGAGYILPVVVAAAGLAAGTEVQVDATGAVIARAAGVPVGYLMTAGGAVGTDALVCLY